MENVLKLRSPFMHGSAVRRLQELGDQLGVDGGPNDGIFGPDTQDVVLRLQAMLGLAQDGICGPKTWTGVLAAVDQQEGTVKAPDPFLGKFDLVHDIRHTHPPPRLFKSGRPWGAIMGVTLHQTGCNMPKNPKGWGRLNAHIGITQEGLIVLANSPLDWIWHAQGLSKFTIGVEIEGNYPGLKDNKKTLWKGGGGPASLNDKMLLALDQCFDLLQWMFESGSQVWRFVHAHRQSAPSRIADPGEEIWQTVGLSWINRLDVIHGPTNKQRDGGPLYTRGKGRPIPREWDSTKPTGYWDR